MALLRPVDRFNIIDKFLVPSGLRVFRFGMTTGLPANRRAVKELIIGFMENQTCDALL
jgi:hypothetical protein